MIIERFIRRTIPFFRLTAAAGFIHVTSDPLKADKAEKEEPEQITPNDEESALIEKFSKLSPEDQSAILRFMNYAAESGGLSDQNDDENAVADWLDEQARLYTQE